MFWNTFIKTMGTAIVSGTALLGGTVLMGGCSGHQPPYEDAEGLLSYLRENVSEGKILFGQQDAFMYGHSWRAASEDTICRSDVKDVCGRHPAVLGLDLGGIELGNERNLDGNPFSFMRNAAVRHYEDGGVITFSWHIRNPLTGGDSWDVSSDSTVASVLEGGSRHGEFMLWLSRCADYLDTFRDSEGRRIPVIFRPWHEHTGSWFWWGKDLCTPDQYKALWKMTWLYMKEERGLDNLVWAYSPGAGVDRDGYMERYPGDAMADILGLDCYQYGELPASNETYSAQLKESLSFMAAIGKEHGKTIALTETGLEGLPYPQWWTEVLYPSIKDFPIAYVLVWRNACDLPGHYYAPWPGQVSEADFRAFSDNDGIVLLPEK